MKIIKEMYKMPAFKNNKDLLYHLLIDVFNRKKQ